MEALIVNGVYGPGRTTMVEEMDDQLERRPRGDETTPYPSDTPQERLAALQHLKGEPWQ
jgi:hypothetical protein